MTQERKQLLIKVLCTMLPYGVKVRTAVSTKELTCEILSKIINGENNFTILPYLRPMSSMTEEEDPRRCAFLDDIEGGIEDAIPNYIDWLNAHHFDYCGLISMGLALEAPEDMYSNGGIIRDIKKESSGNNVPLTINKALYRLNYE